jgi:hypothetical protein
MKMYTFKGCHLLYVTYNSIKMSKKAFAFYPNLYSENCGKSIATLMQTELPILLAVRRKVCCIVSFHFYFIYLVFGSTGVWTQGFKLLMGERGVTFEVNKMTDILCGVTHGSVKKCPVFACLYLCSACGG